MVTLSSLAENWIPHRHTAKTITAGVGYRLLTCRCGAQRTEHIKGSARARLPLDWPLTQSGWVKPKPEDPHSHPSRLDHRPAVVAQFGINEPPEIWADPLGDDPPAYVAGPPSDPSPLFDQFQRYWRDDGDRGPGYYLPMYEVGSPPPPPSPEWNRFPDDYLRYAAGVARDERLLAEMIRRFLAGKDAYFKAHDQLVLDGCMTVSEDERAAIQRVKKEAGDASD